MNKCDLISIRDKHMILIKVGAEQEVASRLTRDRHSVGNSHFAFRIDDENLAGTLISVLDASSSRKQLVPAEFGV
ncbi:unnamed protein product, partial [Musa hybrid cultivar]